MQLVYLHGFATTPGIWYQQNPDYAPRLDFCGIDEESARLATDLEPGSILIGWSMGGMLAIKTAALAQDKLKALVLVSTTPKFLRSADFEFGLSESLLQRLVKKIRSEGISAFHSLIFKDRRPEGLAEMSFKKAEKELHELSKCDLRRQLSELKLPTMIIHGSEDAICLPGAAEYMHKQIANNEIVLLQGVGHAPMIETPGLFNFHIQRFIQNYAR